MQLLRRHHILSVATAAVMLLPIAGAQETRATLNGRVEDADHGAVPNAKVTVRNAASGVTTP